MKLSFSVGLFCIFFLLSSSIIAQNKTIIEDSLYSTVLKEQRRISVYLPSSLRDKKDSSRKYPVLYVLDGDSHKLPVSGILEHFTNAGNSTLPEMIIVCIPNTKRTRDLTPYAVGVSNFIDSSMSKQTGGGDNFVRCIQEDIFPYIQSKYPASSYKALVGHSFGGIFALHVLANYKDMFNDYIVIDPSMWYDDRKFSKQVLSKLKSADYTGKSMFLAIANTTNVSDTNEVKKLKTPFSEHEKSIIDFNRQVKGIKNNLAYASAYYPDDDHTSVTMIAMYDGLRKIFKDYKFSYYDILAPGYKPSVEIPKYFEKLSAKIGYKTNVLEDLLQLADLYYQAEKDTSRQEELRQLYLKLYPENAKKYIESKSK